ncbi:glycosyltransferase family 4 protein [Sediminimonas qiaohouensis]|uniref:glycosyltransferase family 4 protein n=1 Tax=Sediminimonas qiaohouensis TaxID=552061 RepID=UPI0004259C09|nr:glycosyltransferase family 1 protein [Sediminimonas qiaohouensis]
MTRENAPPRLLDVTRLIRRAGRVPTGVDRVELAYLRQFVALESPVFAIARSAYGYALLDRKGMVGLLDRLEARHGWGAVDTLSRLARGISPERRRAEADLRRLSIARCLPVGLQRMLRRHFTGGASYFNVSHSNLSARVLSAMRNGAGASVSVMIHDTIPLDFPQYQRPETPAAFLVMLRRVQAHADVILCNSAQTERDVIRHMQGHGPMPRTKVAHLGVDVPPTDPSAHLPPQIDQSRPWFCTVGTVEPRKNHALLLDLWEEMARTLPQSDMPQLVICGARGWLNEDVFARLDAIGENENVHEIPGLDDKTLAEVLRRSAGMLFPSVAEGYGLPPAEAAALGVPVICTPLSVYHEILGDIPIYLSLQDRYLWKTRIIGLTAEYWAGKSAGMRRHAFQPPTWDSHFKIVFTVA